MDIESQIDYMKIELKKLLSADFRYFTNKYTDLKTKGVYVIYEGDTVIYIGESGNIHQRLYGNLLKGDYKSHTLRNKLYGYNGIQTDRDVNNYLMNKCRFKVLDVSFRKRLEDFASSVINPKFYGKKRRIV